MNSARSLISKLGGACERFTACGGGGPQALLELVRHLNLSIERMTDAAERSNLVSLNLAAALAAKSVAAYQLMAQLLDTAEGNLGATAWKSEHLLRDFADVTARAQALHLSSAAGESPRSAATYWPCCEPASALVS